MDFEIIILVLALLILFYVVNRALRSPNKNMLDKVRDLEHTRDELRHSIWGDDD